MYIYSSMRNGSVCVSFVRERLLEEKVNNFWLRSSYAFHKENVLKKSSAP